MLAATAGVGSALGFEILGRRRQPNPGIIEGGAF